MGGEGVEEKGMGRGGGGEEGKGWGEGLFNNLAILSAGASWWTVVSPPSSPTHQEN